MTVCGLSSQISPASKNSAPIHHGQARSRLRPGQSSCLFLSSWVLRCVFCGKIFWKFLVLSNLTCAQEPRWLRVAWWTRTWTQGIWVSLGNQYCMTKHEFSYPQIVYWLRVSSVWNYPIGWANMKCSQNRIKWPRIESRLHRKSNNRPKFT